MIIRTDADAAAWVAVRNAAHYRRQYGIEWGTLCGCQGGQVKGYGATYGQWIACPRCKGASRAELLLVNVWAPGPSGVEGTLKRAVQRLKRRRGR